MKKDLVTRPLFENERSLLDNLFGRHQIRWGLLDDFFGGEDFVVDITDSEGSINLKAELPGVKKEDLTVDYQDGILTLKAEKKDAIEEKEGERILRRESRYGSMQRSFTVGDIDADNITATFTDGVLNIALKKKDRNFKKIEIQ